MDGNGGSTTQSAGSDSFTATPAKYTAGSDSVADRHAAHSDERSDHFAAQIYHITRGGPEDRRDSEKPTTSARCFPCKQPAFLYFRGIFHGDGEDRDYIFLCAVVACGF